MALASSYIVRQSWQRVEEKAGTSLGRDLSIHLLDAGNELKHLDSSSGLCVALECQSNLDFETQARQEQPDVFALTRNRFPTEMPKCQQLELIKAQMLRVHKAAGHPSFPTCNVFFDHGKRHHGLCL